MKPVSMQHLAKACGVSKNTVSQALRNSPQISKATRNTLDAHSNTFNAIC